MSITERIDHMYSAWLDAKSYSSREGQVRMIQFIRDTLQSRRPRIGVVEAGTGTGKTIAYAASTIPAGRAQDKRVVIVTATVALQDQISGKDLPELRTLTDVPFTFVLAKGRRRYVCPSRLSQSANSTDTQALVRLADSDAEERKVGQKYIELYDAFVAGSWNGDVDQAPETLGQQHWKTVTTDARGCTNNMCTWYNRCPYFKVREQFANVDVIVTNYDLLLSHLRIGTDILPAAEDTIYVLDEAHHLVPKTMGAFTKSCNLVSIETLLHKTRARLTKLLEQMDHQPPLHGLYGEFAEAQEYSGTLIDALRQYVSKLEFRDDREGVRRHRFVEGVVPEELQALAAQLANQFADSVASIVKITSWLRDENEGNERQLGGDAFLELIDELSDAEQQFDEARELLLDFGYTEHDLVSGRWIEHITSKSDEEWRFKSVPIEISEILSERLWNRANATIFTSATLNAGDDFSHFKSTVGLDSSVNALALESPFDFQRAVTFCVPKMASEPKNSDSQSFSKEVARVLPRLMLQEQSALVLFNSRSMMEEVFKLLPNRVRTACLMQTSSGRHALLEKHKRTIDSGQSSYILGLASYREGVDLPGDYCRHVIVTRLPFEVPTDPIIESKQEILEKSGIDGYRLFQKLQLPEATLKLTQACGRLIRNESDWGRITVLDRRIVSRRYGKQILDALPNYRRVIE